MEAFEVRVDDPIVKGEWMFTLRLNEQRLIVEVRQFTVLSCEFAITDTIVHGDDKVVLSNLTKRSERSYLLHTPANLIEAARKPVPVPA